MKLRIFSTLLIILAAFFGINAQEKKSEKKKKNKDQPKLTVVQIEEMPTAEIPVERLPFPAQQPTSNGSLFSDGAKNTNLLIDFKARNIGDLVFVDVIETSTATVSSEADRQRNSGNVGGLVGLVGALPLGGAETAASVIGGLGTREYNGSGSTGRKSNVRARITARVIEVLPNGDLRIQAVKLVKINKETEQLAVTGIVRSKDLAADNSIPTIAIGDLRVEFNGKGIASKDNAPGWLYRLFDKINPF